MMTRLLLLACLVLAAVPVAVEARTCIGEPGPGQVCVQDGVTTLELCPKGECTALEIQRLNEVGLGWRGHPLPHDIQITTQDGYICDYHEEPGHQLIASCPHEKIRFDH